MMRVCIAAVLGSLFAVMPAESLRAQEQDDLVALTPALLQAGQFKKVDYLVADLVERNPRTVDGRFEVFMYVWRIRDFFELEAEEFDAQWRDTFSAWEAASPDSMILPLFRSIQMNASAWRARGRGTNSTVSEEGAFVFRERAGRAWLMVKNAKLRSDGLPIWYELAISLGADAGMPDDVLRDVFDEGIRRFPGYHGIYFAYTRGLAPMWGGDYEAAAAFIDEQVGAVANPEGEALYARLFWLIDQYQRQPLEYFDVSGVDWPKMRAGFERLMKDYPQSRWNHANFASYACRAGDKSTFRRLRKTIDPVQFERAAPRWLTLEACKALTR